MQYLEGLYVLNIESDKKCISHNMNVFKLLIILAFSISLFCGFIMIPQIMNFCKINRLYDIPNARKVHHSAIPRLGGICFLPSMLITFGLILLIHSFINGENIMSLSMWTCMFLLGLSLIYFVGIVDDIAGLKPHTKFIAQIVAASMLPISNLYINNLYGLFGIYEIPLTIGYPLTVFIVVFIINAFNLIDGIDGLAAGLGVLSLVGFLGYFVLNGIYMYALFIAGLIGVLVAYLYFNMFGDAEKNRKIFMGDSGSLTLGYILAFLFVKTIMDNPNVMPFRKDSLLVAYTLLLVPCFDVVRVSLKRVRTGKPIFQADKNHIHHKLMRSGFNQHQALIGILSMVLFFSILNYALFNHISFTYIFIIDAIIYILLNTILDLRILQNDTNISLSAMTPIEVWIKSLNA